jgi:hypothetical protein
MIPDHPVEVHKLLVFIGNYGPGRVQVKKYGSAAKEGLHQEVYLYGEKKQELSDKPALASGPFDQGF